MTYLSQNDVPSPRMAKATRSLPDKQHSDETSNVMTFRATVADSNEIQWVIDGWLVG